MRADTIRWRGVMSSDKPGGLNLADLRTFIDDADELAHQLGAWAGLAVPLVFTNDDCTIHHIWVGVDRRRWRPFPGDRR